MPIVHLRLIENVFSADQKQELIECVTDAVETVYPGLRDVTFVTVDEVKNGDWGIGGEPMTANRVRRHAEQFVSE